VSRSILTETALAVGVDATLRDAEVDFPGSKLKSIAFCRQLTVRMPHGLWLSPRCAMSVNVRAVQRSPLTHQVSTQQRCEPSCHPVAFCSR